jgi:GNAT superfamily N-acetyltransferase
MSSTVYTLRPFNPDTDFPRQVEILNSFEPVKTTIELVKEEHANIPEGAIRREMVATDVNGYMVGIGTVNCNLWMTTRRFWLQISVDPTYRHQGIGSQLYDDLYAFARQQNAVRIESGLPEHLTESKAFAEKRGFVVNRHIFDSILDLDTFDETPYSGVVDAVKQSGIRMFTYADLGDTEENRRKFYKFSVQLFNDVPGMDFPDPPYEQWLKQGIEGSLFAADSHFFAADGDRWVGWAGLMYFKDGHLLVNWMTGIDRAYRGRKIALALKLLTIDYAKQKGVPRMRTNNDSLNAPMLAINRKLGYKPVPGWYRMNKEPA